MRIPSEQIHSMRQRIDAQLASLLPTLNTTAIATGTTPPVTTNNGNHKGHDHDHGDDDENTMTILQRKQELDPEQHWVVSERGLLVLEMGSDASTKFLTLDCALYLLYSTLLYYSLLPRWIRMATKARTGESWIPTLSYLTVRGRCTILMDVSIQESG
jgi:hypothetical protein